MKVDINEKIAVWKTKQVARRPRSTLDESIVQIAGCPFLGHGVDGISGQRRGVDA